MTQIICLANSKKNGDRCIAGIDLQTGKWVRPIYTNSNDPKDGRIPKYIRLIDKQEPQLLDLIDIPLDTKGENFGFQSENLNILPGKWKKIGRVESNNISHYCNQSSYILHNTHKYVTVTFLESLPFSERQTIQLVYTSEVSIKKTVNNSGRTQWKGSFTISSTKKLKDASITDPEFVKKLESSYLPRNPCLVTVSLSMPCTPHEDWEGGDPCWKLIAGIIELP